MRGDADCRRPRRERRPCAEAGQSGTAVLSTVAGGSEGPPAGWRAPAEPTTATRVLGWASAAAIAVSIVLIAAAASAGPSAIVAPIRRTWPMPPWWFALSPSDLSSVGAIYAAVILGTAGVACGLLAIRRGARPAIRAMLAGAAVAAAVLTVLPPGGSTDSISYATYGRIADVGHNPYVMTPAQLRASGDPVGLQTTRNWQNDPSLYGPLATAAQWGAAKLGGTSIGRIIFWLKVLFALAFGAIALMLDRLLRGDPAARARAHLLWSVNPLMLWAVLGGGHIDALAAGLGVAGLLVARAGAGRRPAMISPGRALAAGMLVGAAVAIKSPFALLVIGLGWALRRSPAALAAGAAGIAAVLVPGYLVAGPAAIRDLATRGGNLVTFDSFWRLFYPPFGYGTEPRGLTLIAALACLALAALLAWRLPPGPPGVAGDQACPGGGAGVAVHLAAAAGLVRRHNVRAAGDLPGISARLAGPCPVGARHAGPGGRRRHASAQPVLVALDQPLPGGGRHPGGPARCRCRPAAAVRDGRMEPAAAAAGRAGDSAGSAAVRAASGVGTGCPRPASGQPDPRLSRGVRGEDNPIRGSVAGCAEKITRSAAQSRGAEKIKGTATLHPEGPACGRSGWTLTAPCARHCAAARCFPIPGSTRGTAFRDEERHALGVTGLIPSGHVTLEQQVTRVYAQYLRQSGDLAKNVYLTDVHDRNEVLFYRLLTSHLSEMLPIVYTPTIGLAIEHYSHEYRRPRGVYLSVDHPELIETSLRAPGMEAGEADLIVATDAGAILGIGDWGRRHSHRRREARRLHSGGRDQPEPGTARHARCGHRPAEPARRSALYRQPPPPGGGCRLRPFHRHVRGRSQPASPRALLHWEDIGMSNARRLLDRYRDRLLTFNDDIQGTGAVNLAAVLAAVKAAGTALTKHRVVIFGAGTAGTPESPTSWPRR